MNALDKLVAMQGPHRHVHLMGMYGKWSMSYQLNAYGNANNIPEIKLSTNDHATPESAIAAMYDTLIQAAKGFPEVAPIMLTHQSADDADKQDYIAGTGAYAESVNSNEAEPF